MNHNNCNILIACDQQYYDDWGIHLLRSIHYYNPFINLYVHLVNPQNLNKLKYVHYSEEKIKFENYESKISYLQIVRFLKISEIFKDTSKLVMTIDTDSICTKAFTLKEFVKTAKEISILWRDSEGNVKDPRWLAGLITFGTGNFRHVFAETLRTVRIDTRPGKNKTDFPAVKVDFSQTTPCPLVEWKPGRDQVVLEFLKEKYKFNREYNQGSWMSIAKIKSSKGSVFLTLKGAKQKTEPRHLLQYNKAKAEIIAFQKAEPLIVGIKEAFRNHPCPNLPNFKIVPWEDQETILSADIYFQNNILEQKRKKFKRYYQFILDSGKPFLVVESSIFRKNMPHPPHPKAYHRFSWWSYFRDEGNYNNVDCPSDRWLQIQKDQNIKIKDWRSKLEGEHILLLLQRPGDSSLKNLIIKHRSYGNFVVNVIKEIRQYTDRKIKVRLHPLRQEWQREILEKVDLSGIEISTNSTTKANVLEGGEGLIKDFNEARVVVGFNSNALTESVCEGIPTFSLCPSSMAWECSNTDLSQIENPILNFPRTQWLYNLGYCQWREDEIARGDPWFHLKEIYPDNLK